MTRDNGCYMNYTGSKARFHDKIKHLLPEDEFHTCLDVFTGGNSLGSMLPDNWELTFNDKCKELINCHEVFGVVDVEILLSNLDNTMELYSLSKESLEGYENLKSFFNSQCQLGSVDSYYLKETTRGYLFYLLLCHSFSNYIRFNDKGEWNIPFGKRTFNKNMRKKLINWKERLSKKKKVVWMSKDFRDIDFLEYSFIIVDSPYVLTNAVYNEKGGWTEQDTKDLLEKVDKFAKNGGKFILFEEVLSNGKANTLISDWMNKYNHISLGDNSKGCNYQREDKITLEVCIHN